MSACGHYTASTEIGQRLEKNMTTIYLIRHAEAEGNIYRRIHGQYDGRITPRGYKQIEYLAERFKDVPIDALCTSDLTRTRVTSTAITKYHDLPLNLDPRLREQNMGVWEDLPWGNVYRDDPEEIVYFAVDPAKFEVPESESFETLRTRVAAAITDIAKKNDGKTVAIVSHGMAIRSFISGVLGISSENISQVQHGDNTCVAKFAYENGKFAIDYYNDNSHIPQAISTFASQGWWKNKKATSPDLSNLVFEPMNVEKDAKLYSACYREGWKIAHGSEQGYSDAPYLRDARRVSGIDPRCLMKTYSGDKFAGIVELNPERMADEGVGWVSFCYIVPELRGQDFGVQLLGHAVSYYREKGRENLRLHVSERNKNGISFYEKYAFHEIGGEQGAVCRLKLMEKSLEQ